MQRAKCVDVRVSFHSLLYTLLSYVIGIPKVHLKPISCSNEVGRFTAWNLTENVSYDKMQSDVLGIKCCYHEDHLKSGIDSPKSHYD
jgi:hypothetical protein